jgi:hypothetical protein
MQTYLKVRQSTSIYENPQLIEQMTYFANNFYITSAVFIKISLLLQYLRICKSSHQTHLTNIADLVFPFSVKAGAMRTICRYLLGFTILWGCAFLFVGWFGCLPPAGFWDTTLDTKCYGFGFGVDGVEGFIAAFKAHASTNMCLDVAIFAIPLVLFKRPDLKIKTVLPMIGMFVCGAVYVYILPPETRPQCLDEASPRKRIANSLPASS